MSRPIVECDCYICREERCAPGLFVPTPPPERPRLTRDDVVVFAIATLMLAGAALALVTFLTGCETQPDTRGDAGAYMAPKPGWMRSVEAMGFSDVKEAPYDAFVCAESDSLFASHGWSGVNAQGQRVKGMACCGMILKGCTVRF